MQSSEEILSSVHNGYSRGAFGLSGDNGPEYWHKKDIIKAMEEYARQACYEQKFICAEKMEDVKFSNGKPFPVPTTLMWAVKSAPLPDLE